MPSLASAPYATRLAAYFGALFLIFGVHLPYLPVWLDWKGLGAEEIAWITALPLFLRIVVTPAVAYAADRLGAYRDIVIFLSAVALGLSLALAFSDSIPTIAIAAVGLALVMTTISPLTETLAVVGMRAGTLDYGRTRLWGSLTFILAGLAAGWAVSGASAGVIVWLIAAAAALTLAVSFWLPGSPTATPPSQSAPSLRDTAALATSPVFVIFLLTGGAIQASHAFFYSFGAIELGRQGISSTWIGVLWAIAVLAEVALFVYARAVIPRLGVFGLLLIGGASAVLRWTAMAFEPTLALLIPLQLLHALTFSAAHLGAIEFMKLHVPERLAATAQALYISVAAGFVFGFATLASGSAYVAYGSMGYLAMAALALAGIGGTIVLQSWLAPVQTKPTYAPPLIPTVSRQEAVPILSHRT